MRGLWLLALALVGPMAVQGGGFALYEASTCGTALGGSLLGKAVDASANFYNPATLSDITNITVSLGFVTEHPRTRIKVDGDSSGPLDPGAFMLPHFQLAVPLPWGFAFGLGFEPEFGLGTKYCHYWPLSWDSTETNVRGLVLNPNLAYSITERWSIAAGLRWMYFDFEQYSRPESEYAVMSSRFHANNEAKDLGWQLGTRYRIFDNFAVGATYKSRISVSGDGRLSTRVYSTSTAGLPAAMQPIVNAAVAKAAKTATGDASASFTLPQSAAVGFNWDLTPTVHLGAAYTWTEWSTIDTIRFRLPGGDKRVKLNWKDSHRFAIGPSWDFVEDWTVMASYVYDSDPCSAGAQSTMLPPGDRHIGTVGLAWHGWAGLELALSYGIVFMDGEDMHIADASGVTHTVESHRSLSHAVGFTVTYRF